MKHISAMTWFRLESEALGPGDWLGLRLHLLRCPACRQVRAQRLRLAGPAERGWSKVAWLSLTGAAAATIALLVGVTWQRQPVDELSPKGGSAFTLLEADAGGAPLGETCRPGEVLQGEVRSTRRYVLVLSLSGDGASQVLYPAGGARSVELPKGRAAMPNSWVLDAAPGLERFVAVFSDEPLDLPTARAALDAGRPGAGVEVLERHCLKAPR
jgi:hypothetical protein